MEKSERGKEIVLDCLAYLFGSFIYAVSVNTFTAPNNIAPGGLLGVSTMLNHLTNLPIGIMIIAMNIPLLIFSAIRNGVKFLLRTLVGIILSSVAIDVAAVFLPAYTGDRLLSALFGGVFAGVGLALFFMRGATTGGTDIVARLLQKKLPHISMGKLILLVDLVIVGTSAVVYWSIESALYAIITIFVTSRLIDSILYGIGSNNGRVLFIISKESDAIAESILHDLSRGVTRLEGRGGYSMQRNEILLCAVRRQEITKLKSLVYHIDPGAFMISGDAGDITGEGFGQMT